MSDPHTQSFEQTKSNSARDDKITGWRRLINPAEPIEDSGDRRRMQLHLSFLLVIISLTLVGTLTRLIINTSLQTLTDPGLLLQAGLATILSVAYGLSRAKYRTWGVVLTVGSLYAFPFVLLVARGDYSPAGLNVLVWIILAMMVSSILFSVPGIVILVVTNLLALLLLPVFIPAIIFRDALSQLAFINAISVLVLILSYYRQQVDKSRQTEWVESNRKLQAISQSLEERVADRTQRLEILATLGEQLSAILDRDKLVNTVVERTKDWFGYYQVYIYLLDAEQKKLAIAAGTGPAGENMKAAGYNIPLHSPTNLAARAARTGGIVKIDNLPAVEDWLPHPLAPDACSEIAIPIILEWQVIGVLDVQEDKIGGLDEDDANLLRSLANQVAVAIRNARLFAETETALAEARATQEHYLQQAWTDIKDIARSGQHHYRQPGALPLDDAMAAQLEQLAIEQNQPAVVTVEGDGQATETENQTALLSPIKLRDQVVGTIQLHEKEQQQWSERDMAVIQAVADQVAQAAENLRLFEETRKRASYEQLVGEITQKLRQAPTLESLVKAASKELSNALEVSHSVVKIGKTPEQDET